MSKYKINLSDSHIEAAILFAKSTYALEQEQTAKELNDAIIQKHRAYSIGSIISAVSYLEATINELFFDVSNQAKGVSVENLSQEVADRMKKMWEGEIIEKNSILDKYEVALILADKPFDQGQEPYQSVQNLIRLRNDLVHYKQKLREIKATNEDPTNNDKKTGEEKLKNFLVEEKKIKLNPFIPQSNPFFPDQCLGYGCALWGIQSSVAFTKKFFQEMDLNFHNLPEGLEAPFMKSVQELPQVS